MRKFFVSAALAAFLSAATANAALLVDLRFSDGTKTKAPVAGTYSIDVWAQVTGSNTLSDDGLLNLFGSVQSTQINGGSIKAGTSGITGNAVPNANWSITSYGQIGTAQNLTADGIGDWGTTASTVTTTIKYNSNLGTGLQSVFLNSPGLTPGLDVNAITNGVEFKVGTLTFTLNLADVNSAASAGAATQINWIKSPSTVPSAFSYQIDGGTGFVASPATLYTAGTGVSFATTAIPEPGTLALAGCALAGFVGLRRRRNKAN